MSTTPFFALGLVATIVACAASVTDETTAIDRVMNHLSVRVSVLAARREPSDNARRRGTPQHEANAWERDRIRERAETLATRRHAASFEAQGLSSLDVDIRCDPTCAATGLFVSLPCYAASCPKGHLFSARDEREARWALEKLPTVPFGRNAGSHLTLERVEEAPVGQQNAVFKRVIVPGIPCDRDVVVTLGPGESHLRVERYDGIAELPKEARYTRGEALAAAMAQLAHLDPSVMLEPPYDGTKIRLDPLLVASIAGRATLVHRFLMSLDEGPYVVDVDDKALVVVRFDSFAQLEKTLAR